MSSVRMQRAVPVLFIVALVVLWEVCPRFNFVDPELLPPLTQVLLVIVKLVRDGTLLSAALVTFGEIMTAWLIVIPFGVGCGLIIAADTWVSRLMAPFFRIFLSI